MSGGRRSPARWHPVHGAPKREQVKVSFLSIFSARGTSKIVLTCVSNQGFDLGIFVCCLLFGDGHGVEYSCAHPRFDFLQSSAEYALGSFWVNIAVPNRW